MSKTFCKLVTLNRSFSLWLRFTILSCPPCLSSVVYVLTSSPSPELSMYPTPAKFNRILLHPFFQQARDDLTKHNVAFANCDPAPYIDHRNLADLSRSSLHSYAHAPLRANAHAIEDFGCRCRASPP